MSVQNIFGHLLSLSGIEWEIAPPDAGSNPECLIVQFPFHRSTPAARDARKMVARELLDAPDVDWFRVRGSTWQVDLLRLRERFKLDLNWLEGTIAIEPEYDVLSETFHPEVRFGVLSLVFERDSLQAAPEVPWDEYPDDEAAELVPLLRRTSFNRDIERLFQRATPDRVSAVAMLDLDHFKSVNDKYGHQAGDAVLIKVAEIVRTITGRRGRGYRYGGEELAVLLPDFTVEEALPLLERIRAAVRMQLWPEFDGLVVTISIGVSAAKGATEPLMVVKVADGALYAAKRGGRNRIEHA